MKDMINVMLVDDQALIREGLTRLLKLAPGITVSGQAKDGESCIQQLSLGFAPDIILLDIRMPKCSGLEVLSYLQTESIKVPALVLTTFDEHSFLIQAMQAGAKGYLLKDIELEQLVHAIKRVLQGELVVQPALTARLIENMSIQSARSEQWIEPLTVKERDILKLIASGLSNKEIALSLHNAEGTVRNQVSNILSKLAVRDRTRAVLKAIELGLLKP